MRPDVFRWFERSTFRSADSPDPATLATLKAGQTVSVVIPALDEEPTVARVVTAACALIEVGLVDEVLVIDGGSRDATVDRARAAGAQVVALASILPAYGQRPGKGEAMWKALDGTDGDLVVYVDADVVDPSPQWISGLLWPLIADPAVAFVKACYDRPLALPGGGMAPTGGGRVTELAARPLLDLLWPALAGVVQPLAGECAARRTLLETLPYAGGYAVELGLLLDAYAAVGLPGLAQVDLGVRQHRNRDTAELGRMAGAVLAEALSRLPLTVPGNSVTQFLRDKTTGAFGPVDRTVRSEARPPIAGVAEYAARRARAS